MNQAQAASQSQTIAVTKAARKARNEVRRLGHSMGALSAAHWSGLRNAERFKYMTIVDYRDSGLEDCFKDLTAAADQEEFTQGFLMGFEDVAYDSAQAGVTGFEDVLEAGNVDYSIKVTARRLLKQVVDARA